MIENSNSQLSLVLSLLDVRNTSMITILEVIVITESQSFLGRLK